MAYGNYDDEQIAKFGLAAHMRMTAAPFMRDAARRREQLVKENIDAVLALLPDATEEDRMRATFAIPNVVYALASPPDLVLPEWQMILASRTYDDWQARMGQKVPLPYSFLSEEDRKPFIAIVDAVIQVQNAKVPK